MNEGDGLLSNENWSEESTDESAGRDRSRYRMSIAYDIYIRTVLVVSSKDDGFLRRVGSYVRTFCTSTTKRMSLFLWLQ